MTICTYSHTRGDWRGKGNISICTYLQPYTGWFKRKSQYLGRCSVGHCEKRSTYEHVSNSEWLPR
jgi:hypothetical protein